MEKLIAFIFASLAGTTVFAADDFEDSVVGKPSDGFQKAMFKLHIPPGVKHVRAVIVFRFDFENPIRDYWRQAADKMDAAVLWYSVYGLKPGAKESLEALEDGLLRLAKASKHVELETAPLVIWTAEDRIAAGFNFIEEKPERIVAFVACHPRPRSRFSTPDKQAARKVPALFICLAEHAAETPPVEFAYAEMRKKGAPWALCVERNAPAVLYGRTASLAIPYIAAVINQRTPPPPPGGKVLIASKVTLKDVDNSKAWLTESETKKAFPMISYSKPKEKAGWLPDQDCADKWEDLENGRAGPKKK